MKVSEAPALNIFWSAMGVALVFVLMAAGPAFAADYVWIVDDSGGPGVDFTNIPDAVDAAGDGDVLLIQAGYYSGGLTTIDGKSLTICADADATVILDDLYFRVKNLAAHQTVTFRELRSSQYSPVYVTAMEFKNNAGTIWVEDCDLFGGFHSPSFPLIRIESCDRVIFERTVLKGRYTELYMEDPVSGLEAWDSSVYLHGCTVWGGTGIGPHGFYMTYGASAVVIHGGFLYAAGCAFHGCDSGDGDAGHGVHLADGDPSYYHTNVVHEGGSAFTPPGLAGSPIQVDSGFEQELTSTPNSFSATSPHRSNTNVTLTFEGAPNDDVVLLFNTDPTAKFFLGYKGPLLVKPSNMWIWHLGSLSPAGTKVVSFKVPALSGLNSFKVYHQAILIGDNDTVLLGGGSFILYIGG